MYFIASENVHLNSNASAICAFFVAVTNNYVMNHLWTFKIENKGNALNIRQFLYYMIGNINGLFINLCALNVVVIFAGIDYHFYGQALGIFLGMLSNFIFANKFVFNKQATHLVSE